jgi:ankyrin repeat protein
MLIQAGVDVNSSNEYGRTILMFASASGHREIVDVLLKYGADINAKDGRGRTAMIHARSSGHDEIVKILQEAKAQKL